MLHNFFTFMLNLKRKNRARTIVLARGPSIINNLCLCMSTIVYHRCASPCGALQALLMNDPCFVGQVGAGLGARAS